SIAKCAFGQGRALGKSGLLTQRCDIRQRLERVAKERASVVGYLEVPDAMTSNGDRLWRNSGRLLM
ncbi:MAG: hypothetical protein VW865_13320, partial [Halieaceae bacterium]